MTKAFLLFLAVCIITNVSAIDKLKGIGDTLYSPYAALRSVDIDDFKWTNGFWAKRFEQIHKHIHLHLWKYFNGKSAEIGMSGIGSNHAVDNFRIAADLINGAYQGSKWMDGDFYKWIEAVAYVYAVTKYEKLNQLMDKVIDLIGKAQEPDGYINTYMTISGKKCFQNVQDHETYNMGHLMTAGCVHYRATGKTSLLSVARKAGDCLHDTFMHTDKHFLGYSSIMGLVELYRTTGEKKYLDLANHFINLQGTGDVEFGEPTYTVALLIFMQRQEKKPS